MNDFDGFRAMMRRELQVDHADHQRDRTLWHYTDFAGAEGILRERAIRATHYSCLNDETELKLGERAVRDAVEGLAANATGDLKGVFRDYLADEGLQVTEVFEKRGLYLVSFSEACDDLPQWRAYGGRTEGYAIGLHDVEAGCHRISDADASEMLVKLTYDEGAFRELVKAQMLRLARRIVQYRTVAPPHYANELTGEGRHLMHLRAATLALRLKHPAFATEQEWRMIVAPRRDLEKSGAPIVLHRTNVYGPAQYVMVPLSRTSTISLKRVLSGPGQEPSDARMQKLLTSLGYPDAGALVQRSSIPLRALSTSRW